MLIALLRVGIDTGSGGIHAPLFKDGTFEYISIPDGFGGKGVSKETYGNLIGRYGKKLITYFPEQWQAKMEHQSVHLDPEFKTFTYGDPSTLKGRLRDLQKGDLLIFYCGLQGYDFESSPALYICGYFEVEKAGIATTFSDKELKEDFGENFHVKHKVVFDDQKDRLVVVKGSNKSRLLKEAMLLSEVGQDINGKPRKVLSKKMQGIFGDFDGKVDIQRSPPRWVRPEFIEKAATFVRSLK